MNRLEKKTIIAVILLVLGVVITMQFRTVFNTKKLDTAASLDMEKLQVRLENEIQKGEVLKDQIKANEEKLNNEMKSTIDNTNNTELKKQIDRLKFIAGVTGVKGPGILVSLNDALEKGTGDPNEYLVHNIDVIRVVNELKAGGARAISINNERVIATSELVCTGPTIIVNKNRHVVPFEIRAIGDYSKMESTLKDSVIYFALTSKKIRINLTHEKELYLPPYNNKLDELISGLEEIGQ